MHQSPSSTRQSVKKGSRRSLSLTSQCIINILSPLLHPIDSQRTGGERREMESKGKGVKGENGFKSTFTYCSWLHAEQKIWASDQKRMTPSPALPQFVPFRSCTTILYTLRLLCISPSRSLSQHNTAAYSEENDGFVTIDRSTNVATPLRPPPSAPFRL